MRGWLIDTNVLSAFAPGKSPVSSEVASWFETRTAALFLSAVTAAEIEAGIAKLRRSGAEQRADALRTWFDQIVSLHRDRVLAFDLTVARIAGALSDIALARGQAPGFADIVIAATAKAHELTLLTANLRHFEPLAVDAFNPLAVQAR